MSSNVSALVRALRAVAPDGVPRSVTDWFTVIQSSTSAVEAMRAVFGRRLPTAPRFGEWLQNHVGFVAGELTLFRCGRQKVWRYAVATAEEIDARQREAAAKADVREKRREELAAEEDRRAAVRAQRRKDKAAAEAAKPRVKVTLVGDALAELIGAAPASGPIEPTLPQRLEASHSGEFLQTVSYNSDGQPRVELTRDRNGEPIPARRSAAPKSAPVPEPEPPKVPSAPARMNVTPRTANDSRLPPWVREGRQPTKAELAGRHQQTERPASFREGDWFAEACAARNRRYGGY